MKGREGEWRGGIALGDIKLFLFHSDSITFTVNVLVFILLCGWLSVWWLLLEYVYVCVLLCVCVCMYVFVCVCVCVGLSSSNIQHFRKALVLSCVHIFFSLFSAITHSQISLMLFEEEVSECPSFHLSRSLLSNPHEVCT